MSCLHKRTKKNFPFGRNSQSDKFCKDCGKRITNKIVQELKNRKKGGF